MQVSATHNRVIIALTVMALSMIFVLAGWTRNVDAASFVVANVNDSGPGSLRQTILDATASPGADTITFHPTVTGTITILSEHLPSITDDLTIIGPGADVLAVSGNSLFNIFAVGGSEVTVSISGLSITNGFGGSGGGIHNTGILTIANSKVSDNTAVVSGGGIYNGGRLTITNSTFSGNTALLGGGIYENGLALTITNSTFANNSATLSGGGIYDTGGSVAITSSTFSGNSAAVLGGGIYSQSPSPFQIINSTIVNNSAQIGGGGVNIEGQADIIRNTLIANNSSGGNCRTGGTVTTSGVNFSTDGSCFGFTQVTPSQLNLGPLADNGGPTLTHALLEGSVAIDAILGCTDASGSALTSDQRGAVRPADGDGDGIAQCDVGAFEAPARAVFDVCLQDESNPTVAFLGDSSTGEYRFCCDGTTFTGRAKVTRKGSLITFQHATEDRRLTAKFDGGTSKGSASLQSPLGVTRCTIMDRNTRTNSCSCK